MSVEISFVLADNLNMIKTYEIDLDDELVENANGLFENLGIDIDTAIKIFLKQAILRKGFPFEVVIPKDAAETAPSVEVAPATKNIEKIANTTESEDVVVPPVSPEIAARVAANEALVAEMRNEIGEKEVTPEFDENEDDGTHGDYDASPVERSENEGVGTEAAESVPAEKAAIESDNAASEETSAPAEEESEDEDETTPDNLFDAWGDEEEIGCR